MPFLDKFSVEVIRCVDVAFDLQSRAATAGYIPPLWLYYLPHDVRLEGDVDGDPAGRLAFAENEPGPGWQVAWPEPQRGTLEKRQLVAWTFKIAVRLPILPNVR